MPRGPRPGFNRPQPGSVQFRAMHDRALRKLLEAGRRESVLDARSIESWGRSGFTAGFGIDEHPPPKGEGGVEVTRDAPRMRATRTDEGTRLLTVRLPVRLFVEVVTRGARRQGGVSGLVAEVLGRWLEEEGGK